ncbi:helix-turn-helix domain-containing protein [Paenibacillus koleovorans]|uniref:helix-turn-helix domain-containing protein n=1 Tax=Paenibacillus koleovorans TaxID=121608 RepID=UPI000FD6EE92|nr:helix-turn-helix domain-containing protein [Paenibacillus koleovorans]
MKNNAIVTDLPEPYQNATLFLRKGGWSIHEHDHLFYQLIYVMDGVVHIAHSGQHFSVSRGQLAIIPSELRHSLRTDNGYQQLGIDLNVEPDRRGLNELLANRFKDFTLLNKPDLLYAITELVKEVENQTIYAKLKMASMMDQILLSFLEDPDNRTQLDFRNKLLSILNGSLTEKVRLHEVAREFMISTSQLEKLTRQQFGSGVIALHNNLRINQACSLLLNSEMPIVAIASRLGYYDLSHFSHVFKQKMRMSASDYRKHKAIEW